MPTDSVKKNNQAFMYVYHLWVIVEMETLKIFKDPTEVISRSLQPALWLLFFGEAFNHMRVIPTGDVSYLAFLTPGILAQSITFVSIFNGLSIIWERDMGVLQKMLTTPIQRSALVLGKMLAGSVRSFSQLIVILTLATLLGIHLQWGLDRVLFLILLTVLGSTLFTGFSMIIASIVRTRERMMGIGQLVTMPLFFASNALYPVAMMPDWLKVFAAVNPMSYLVDGLRSLLLQPVFYSVGEDIAVLAACSAGVLAIATRLYPTLPVLAPP